MLLTIPVIVASASWEKPRSGLLTQYRNETQTLLLCLDVSAPLVNGDKCEAEFNLPECAAPIKFTGVVVVNDDPLVETPHCRTVTLGNIKGAEALAFCSAGSLMESGRSWDEMRRH